MTGIEDTQLETACEFVTGKLNEIERRTHAENGYHLAPPEWHLKERRLFWALDCGTSGAFLIEKATGELYNIKAYGVPDRNKKVKANLGTIVTVDPETLYRKRWNYLR